MDCQLLKPEELDPFFAERDFFPRPDWKAIADRLDQDHPGRVEVWDDAARIWLRKLVDHLGEPYQFTASSHFLVLSALSDRRTGWLHEMLEHTRRRVISILDNAERWQDAGFHVLLLFDDSEALHAYMSGYGSNQESAPMAGGFLSHGYMHMAMYAQELWRLEPVIVHEMTHNLLAPSRLPLWLEEGVCQVMEGMLGHAPRTERDTAVNQRAFWQKHGLQSFWDGCGFEQTDTSEKAYELARVLVLVLSERKRFLAPFVKAAVWTDAGFGAAAELGVDLEEVVRDFLGPGDWKPDFSQLD